jgi:hypothetical protein
MNSGKHSTYLNQFIIKNTTQKKQRGEPFGKGHGKGAQSFLTNLGLLLSQHLGVVSNLRVPQIP